MQAMSNQGRDLPSALLDHRYRWQLAFVAEVQRLTSGEADMHQVADAASEAYLQHRKGDPTAIARELWE